MRMETVRSVSSGCCLRTKAPVGGRRSVTVPGRLQRQTLAWFCGEKKNAGSKFSCLAVSQTGRNTFRALWDLDTNKQHLSLQTMSASPSAPL